MSEPDGAAGVAAAGDTLAKRPPHRGGLLRSTTTSPAQRTTPRRARRSHGEKSGGCIFRKERDGKGKKTFFLTFPIFPTQLSVIKLLLITRGGRAGTRPRKNRGGLSPAAWGGKSARDGGEPPNPIEGRARGPELLPTR